MFELRVTCDLPTCQESGVVKGDPVDETVQSNGRNDGFFFIYETVWVDAPKGWTLAPDETMRCPKHREPKSTQQTKEGKTS
jgi:hypothetical protein